ncbi:hypothetical protein QFZ70_001476 [Arthrobacter sp. V1I9]|uniref:hypothetical protein n=1 Tax=Arthrobacter sp. V1I9 TaxID=3042275 RepID=UPI002794B789|nr:hypothetical protein [Arthrobacter sp. V1I9]MDQ0869003.1 hypothetical protein [Arthrobacter sp. V1I9]
MDKHIYPPQKKIGSEPLSVTVPVGTKETLKLYRFWLQENGLPDAANGTVLFVNTVQHNDKFREIFYEIEKGKSRGKRYLDGIKATKASQSAR